MLQFQASSQAGKKRKKAVFCQASKGMDKAGMQEGMETSLVTRRAFQKCAFYFRAAGGMRETAGPKTRGKKKPWEKGIQHLIIAGPCSFSASSSTSVASSSSRRICSHNETSQLPKTPFTSSPRSHFQKHRELLPPAVKLPAAKIIAAILRLSARLPEPEKNVIKDDSKPTIVWERLLSDH